MPHHEMLELVEEGGGVGLVQGAHLAEVVVEEGHPQPRRRETLDPRTRRAGSRAELRPSPDPRNIRTHADAVEANPHMRAKEREKYREPASES